MSSPLHLPMSWLHTWSGLLLSWLLYFMFITGTLGYFENEIDRWMKPEINVVDQVDEMSMLLFARDRLKEVGSDAKNWWIELPTNRSPFLTIWWQDFDDKETGKKGNGMMKF